MPYKSLAQLRYMHAAHPDIAKRWDKKYGKTGHLPGHVRDMERSVARKMR